MANMKGECEEGGTAEDIPVKLLDTNCTLKRPKNFNSHRRNNVYYFSDNSGRGILKRVPVKNGYYRMNELQTVLENPDIAKIGHGIRSDGPLNNPAVSKANAKQCTAYRKNDSSASEYQTKKAVLESYNETAGFVHLSHVWHTASRSDDSSALEYQKGKAVSKSRNETAGIDHLSYGLEKLAIRKTSKDSKTKNPDLQSSKMINKDSNEAKLYIPSKRHRKKKYQLNVLPPTASKNLEVWASDEKYEKLSASSMRRYSPLKKPDKSKDNLKSLSETWTERNLNEALSMNEIMKTPFTEL